jgi:hypothetical protein
MDLSISLFTVIKIRGVVGRQLRPDTLCHVTRAEIITGSLALFSVLSEPYGDRPVQTYGVAHKTIRLILIFLVGNQLDIDFFYDMFI